MGVKLFFNPTNSCLRSFLDDLGWHLEIKVGSAGCGVLLLPFILTYEKRGTPKKKILLFIYCDPIDRQSIGKDDQQWLGVHILLTILCNCSLRSSDYPLRLRIQVRTAVLVLLLMPDVKVSSRTTRDGRGPVESGSSQCFFL